MTGFHNFRIWAEAEFGHLAHTAEIPGAALIVACGDHQLTASTGVQSVATGNKTTGASVFEIGSIAKVWTATLIMQLVDEGLISLDEPIRNVLPGFALQDHAAARSLTTRHLLSHSAGFEGDIFTDDGDDDSCITRYVDGLATAPQYFPPGQVFSYSNAGYTVLGRIVEVMRGMTYDEAVETYICRRTGLANTFPVLDAAPAHHRVSGHVRDQSGHWNATDSRLPRSSSPAGTRLAATVGDLAAFGTAHLRALTGHPSPLISLDSALRMSTPQAVEVPDLAGQWPEFRGLGWEIDVLDSTTILAHDGDTIGQHAFLRVVPQYNLVIALLTNGGEPRPLIGSLLQRALQDLSAGRVIFPAPAQPSKQAGPVEAILGTYTSMSVDSHITLKDGTLWLHRTPKGLLAQHRDRSTSRLEHVRGATYFAWPEDTPEPVAYAFAGTETGRAVYLHNGRANPRA